MASFEVQGEIAKGQTGTIYYGYDMELRQEVAIKIYHSHINGRLVRGKEFIEKSKPLLRLEHPNLIKIFKVEETDDTPVVFMEFFDAPSLQHIIHEEGPLPVAKMLLLAREIAEVLVHTHFQGIIHGTLHPGHVLVGPQGQVKVMDLGLSWILMDILSNCDAELLLPLPYLLPEIAKGELLNVSSDLYCLGFMMYHMLTKRVPYSGLPKTSIMGKLAFDQADPDFDFSNDIPEAICELIREMTRNKAQHRIQDATHVLTILNQQLAKLAPETSNPPPATSKPGPAKKRPNAVKESPAPQPHVQAPDPTPNQAPDVNQQKNSIDHQGINKANLKKRLGFTLGIILLLMGVTMGYWYRDFLEIPLTSRSTELTNPTQPLILGPPPPIDSSDSSGTIQTQIPMPPPQNTFNTEDQSLNTDGLQNTGTSTEVPHENSKMEDPGLSLDELKNVGTPSLSSQENTKLRSPGLVQQPDPDTNSGTKQPKAVQPQNSPSLTNQPLGKKNLAPVMQPSPTPKPSSTISEKSQEAPQRVTKEPVPNSDLPSGPINETTKGIQESTPASLKQESMENFERKELKELLESTDASETGTTLPTDQNVPLPAASSAHSSPESSQ
ncbi:MAG: protein kinase [Nitrospirales bacterium]